MNKTKTPEPPVLDEALLDRARAGDREALTVLYEATSLEVYRTVHALVRDEDLTLDIQQDAYLQAFSHLDQLREATAFLPWLRQIAVNAARAQLRKKRPLLFTELGGDPEADTPELPDPRPEDSPELALDRKENARLIREILGELSDGQRLLLGMYYYEQMSVREIAEKLELSPGTVKAQLYRGRKRVEDRVRRLEEQGVRLFGLSPLPFLLTLLRRQEPGPETAGRTMAAVLPETVAVHTGRSFFQTLLGRVCLGLLTVSVIAGGVLGWRWIRNRAEIGDYQPPDTMDTAEDLIPETTEPVVTWDDTPEDLTTEPVTEPEPTEPEPTKPHAGSGKTEPSPEPSGEQDPQPSETPSQPPEDPPVPEVLNPTGNPPDPFSQPGEEPTTEAILLFPRIVSCSWGDSDELYDVPWGSQRYLTIVTEDGASPTVYTDNESVIALRSEGYWNSETDARQKIYRWEVCFLGPGTAHVFCAYNNVIEHVFSVSNPAYPDEILQIEVDRINRPEEVRLLPNQNSWLSVFVQGSLIPELTSDNPSVLQLGERQTLHNGQDNWIKTLYGWLLQPRAAGTAHVTVHFGGNAVYTVTVVVTEQSGSNADPDSPDTAIDSEITGRKGTP